VDVWFESGASWNAVLVPDPELRWPADLYTEGGDQHRGWFHSSLLTSVGLRNAAPYRSVATSGWTLDEQGRAFSKSLGNGVDPVDVAERMGAEIVRLWVASVDFREDVVASENLMKRVAENYRKLRNTFRFLLGNLHGFDPADALPWEKLEPLDQYMLARTRDLVEKTRRWYEGFEFHRIYHAVNEFAIVDLSAIYLDVLKDRMYTFAPTSQARRSAQTVLWQITETLVRLVAPILSFTADEVWEHLPPAAGREPSVHLAYFPLPDELAMEEDAGHLLREWEKVFAVREAVMKSLEEARQHPDPALRIGKALEARVIVGLPPALYPALRKYERSLKELFNVSQVELRAGAADAILVTTEPAEGERCARCWNYRTDLGVDARWAAVCGRCAEALAQMGAPAIAESPAQAARS
jgi:isoleucyl-tRNA synthetase